MRSTRAVLLLMKAKSARHEICWGVTTSGVKELRMESNGGPGEAGGDAGKNFGVLAEGPWAGEAGGEGLRLSADEGCV